MHEKEFPNMRQYALFCKLLICFEEWGVSGNSPGKLLDSSVRGRGLKYYLLFHKITFIGMYVYIDLFIIIWKVTVAFVFC